MPKLSPEKRAELEAQLAADDDDDENDEVEIGLGEGKYFRGSYSRAKRLGYVTEPEPKPAKDESKDTGTVKRFTGGRRTG